MDKNQQEMIMKLGMFEQQIRQLQEQVNAVEQGIVELNSLNVDLEEIKNSEGKEIFSAIGRGIFIKSKISSEELLVDIGQRKFVKKSVPETRKIIEEQTKKLEEVKKELNDNLENIGNEIEKTIKNSEKK